MVRIASLWVNEDKTVSDGTFDMVAVTGDSWTHEIRVQDKTVARLWKSEKKDKNGNHYYSGSFGKERDVRCMVFRNTSDNPNAPAYRVMVEIKDRNENAQPQTQVVEPEIESDDLPF